MHGSSEDPMGRSGLRFPVPTESSFEAWRTWFRAFAGQTALGVHEVELAAVDDDQLTLVMEVGPHARQPYGLLHGGVSMLLAESAASLHACWRLDLSKRVPVGIEINGSHLEGMRDGRVTCTARQIRRSKTFAHHVVEVRDPNADRVLSTARVTNYYRRVG
jgi:uncharacterized protein (TIGR00369 family)